MTYKIKSDNYTRKLVILQDMSHRMVWVNQDYANELGKSLDEIIGRMCHDIRHDCNTLCSDCHVKKSLQIGEPYQAVTHLADGKVVLTECYPLRDGSGNLTGAMEIIQNITEIIRTEEALKFAQDSINNAPYAMVWMYEDGKIARVNETTCRMFGYTEDELIGRHILDLDVKLTSGKYAEFWNNIKGGASSTAQTECRVKDGRIFPAEIISNHLVFDSREYCCSIIRDITERLGLEIKLRQSQKLQSIGALAAGIAHEINTPIQYVGDNTQFIQFSIEKILDLNRKYNLLFSELRGGRIDHDGINEVAVMREESNIEELAGMVSDAIRESLEGINRISDIVRAMKNFSYVGSVQKNLVDISESIRNTITVASNEWKFVADVELDLDETIPPVTCIQSEFNQVILNLVINAAQAIRLKLGDNPETKGRIIISTRLCGDIVEIRISDTGPGIPFEIRDRIFDPFFTTKDVGKGAGQGLAVAHAVITEKHKGEITLETELDVGTTFIIRIPMWDSDDGMTGDDFFEDGER